MSDHSRPTGHETRDLSFKAIALFGLGLLLLLAVGGLILVGLFTVIVHQQAQSDVLPARVTPTLPPQPRLQVVPGNTLQQQRAAEDQQLSTYGWIDRQHDIAHIPIDRAMDLFARQNQPAQPQGEWF